MTDINQSNDWSFQYPGIGSITRFLYDCFDSSWLFGSNAEAKRKAIDRIDIGITDPETVSALFLDIGRLMDQKLGLSNNIWTNVFEAILKGYWYSITSYKPIFGKSQKTLTFLTQNIEIWILFACLGKSNIFKSIYTPDDLWFLEPRAFEQVIIYIKDHINLSSNEALISEISKTGFLEKNLHVQLYDWIADKHTPQLMSLDPFFYFLRKSKLINPKVKEQLIHQLLLARVGSEIRNKLSVSFPSEKSKKQFIDDLKYILFKYKEILIKIPNDLNNEADVYAFLSTIYNLISSDLYTIFQQ